MTCEVDAGSLRNPPPTSDVRKKLEKALLRLSEDHGYFAEPDWGHCQSCGCEAIPDDFHDAYVFFHEQEADRLDLAGFCFRTGTGMRT
jgi:hypothetical protein